MDDFFVECDEHLTTLRRTLLEMEEQGERSPAAGEHVRTVARVLHTLKGLSGMVGFGEVEQLAHALEDWMRAATTGGAMRPGTSLDPLFRGTGLMEQAIAARRGSSPPPEMDPFLADLDHEARALSTGGASPRRAAPGAAAALDPRALAASARGDALFAFEFVPTPERVARGVGVEAVRGWLAELGELITAAPRVLEGGGVAFRFLVALPAGAEPPAAWGDDGITWEPFALPADEAGAESRPEVHRPEAAAAPATVVRVELARLDELMRLVGELVISRARLADALEHGGGGDTLLEINTAMERQLRELRDGVMRVRLVPVGEVFERMRFVVRDVAQEAGKRVQVEIHGQGTEIDKLVVERIMEPLLHLVRNAVSHGIEAPAEREGRGKPPEGRLVLRASAAGERVVIEVQDDGRGVDVQRVAERARAQGILAAGAALDGQGLLDVLSAPGFSTRDHADRASGRGVGMEVVRSTIRELGGEIAMHSEPGRGTRFVIELPLTLMIVDALLVKIGDQTMALPQPALQEVLRIGADDITPFENNEVLRYRGGVLPLARLRRLFRVRGGAEPASPYVLVVGTQAQPVGLVVDRLGGLREIVVRPVADPLVAVPGISGAAELGDGRVCLILDAAALAQMARERPGERPALLVAQR
jgi:two-component system chemotaxis sensor kinase CheA